MIYQFKLTLEKFSFPVWRRIVVPADDTFAQLRIAIHESMDLKKASQHQFEIFNSRYRDLDLIGQTDDPQEEDFIIDENKMLLRDYFSLDNTKAKYTHNDHSFEISILLERIMPKKLWVEYPLFLEGEGTFAQQEIMGPIVYGELSNVLNNSDYTGDPKLRECVKQEVNLGKLNQETMILKNEA